MGPDSYCILIGADIRGLESTLADPHPVYEVDISHGKCNKQAGKNEANPVLKMARLPIGLGPMRKLTHRQEPELLNQGSTLTLEEREFPPFQLLTLCN